MPAVESKLPLRCSGEKCSSQSTFDPVPTHCDDTETPLRLARDRSG